MNLEHFNIAAVVVAALSTFVIGGLWYSPLLFGRAWMRENMPDAELRRQRAAYRQGVLRAAAVALLIVAVIGLFAFFAFHQRNLAQAEAARADQNLQQANLNADATRQALTEAEAQRQAAINQQMIAEAQRTRAENQQEINYQQLYAAQMNLAGQAWEQANVERMNELLDFHLPQTSRSCGLSPRPLRLCASAFSK